MSDNRSRDLSTTGSFRRGRSPEDPRPGSASSAEDIYIETVDINNDDARGFGNRGSGPRMEQRSRLEIVEQGFESKPLIIHYPILSSTGKSDPAVQKFDYSHFPSPVVTDRAIRRLPHWSLRYWLKFVDSDGNMTPAGMEPDFDRDANARNMHTEVVRRKLVENGIVLPEFAEAMNFYYGSTTVNASEGKHQGGVDDEDEEEVAYKSFIDIQLPTWSVTIADLLIEVSTLSTNTTRLVWAGKEAGIGPLAPPEYALAEMTMPARMDGRSTSTTRQSFDEHCNLVSESFKAWTARHDTRQEIVGFGGYFQDNGTPEGGLWDLRMFCVYKVPVSAELAGTNDASKLRPELRKFPAFTMINGAMIRNSLNFRFGCAECAYKAKYIHDVKGHICALCNRKGHLKKDCELTRRAVKRKVGSDTPQSFTATIEPGKYKDHQYNVANDPELQRFEELARAKRARRS